MEIWKDVIGYEGIYQVSNLGNIKSLGRIAIRKDGSKDRFIHEKPMGKSIDKYGYYKTSLRKVGIHKTPTLHRLVAIAFLEKPEDKNQVNHINGNKLDNRVENLEWCNNSENIQHAFDIGLKKGYCGEANVNCTTSKETILGIRDLNQRGISIKELSIKFEKSENYIRRIVRGDRWKHLI